MSFKDWRVRIEDILEAIERIRRYTGGMTEAQFVADDRTVDAVIRNLEIVGEAAKRVPVAIVERHPEIPWSRMTEMRNILVHEYHSVDPSILFDTARHDMPPLIAPLRALLNDGGGG
ncbi:hypothetical protein CU669_14265 [Paramagnetospirillum kuznetsovii]|uniref:DUF86 domain-containing protein n=1 Tax=Paramagnetospirillum kuznetsovii TaxID=2053833 RepID=A0A364NWG7_9PROT|nr:DUF86 domain-containing protein [Paramagnetospirillum kuznetsovii]RAU21330.1 hypothetical protein CU669_14265 [Paramagnetospirillum kuznetsovii]